MTCKNTFVSIRRDESVVGIIYLKDAGGKEHSLGEIVGVTNYPGLYWSFMTFDAGCQCMYCNAMHDVYAEFSKESNREYNKKRVASLNEVGWGGNAFVKMAEGWLKTAKSEVSYPNGLVCCRCNARNEYAGAEHLKEGKYVCYNCK